MGARKAHKRRARQMTVTPGYFSRPAGPGVSWQSLPVPDGAGDYTGEFIILRAYDNHDACVLRELSEILLVQRYEPDC